MFCNLPPDWSTGWVLTSKGQLTGILTNGRRLDPAKVCIYLQKFNILEEKRPIGRFLLALADALA